MTKKQIPFRTRFARAKREGKWFFFWAKPEKRTTSHPLFASEASKKHQNAFLSCTYNKTLKNDSP